MFADSSVFHSSELLSAVIQPQPQPQRVAQEDFSSYVLLDEIICHIMERARIGACIPKGKAAETTYMHAPQMSLSVVGKYEWTFARMVCAAEGWDVNLMDILQGIAQITAELKSKGCVVVFCKDDLNGMSLPKYPFSALPPLPIRQFQPSNLV